MNKWNLFFRKWHRDVGFLIAGILLSFAISGIALNHRDQWNPEEYTYQVDSVYITLPPRLDKKNSEQIVKKWLEKNNFTQEYRKHRIKNQKLRISLNHGIVEFDTKTGSGELELTHKRPFLGQMVSLHRSTKLFWIWYSDIYGLLVIFMVISGLTLSKGKYSFKKQGWKLLFLGIIFPIIILFFI